MTPGRAFETEKSIAHVRLDAAGHWQTHPLHEHLRGTAEMAQAFAESFGNGDWAAVAAHWHDLGKYKPDFQAFIRASSGYDAEAHLEGAPGKVDHSAAGAILAVEKLRAPGRVLAYLIAGHHAGLPDWSHEIGVGGDLQSRLSEKRHLLETLAGSPPPDILDATAPVTPPCGRPFENPGHAHLWVRMLFSCLVDADFLDTEAFMDPGKARERNGESTSLSPLKDRFDAFMASKQAAAPNTPVNELRRQVLEDCRKGAAQAPGLFSLTVPTGGGKTLSSMAFALEHAIRYGKQRIIVVIPYTSIIEQTAAELENVFGRDAVLEHHSNLDPDRETQKSRLACENWDAPIVVTTNVQLFESLFASRTSACRKLHNVANSVVVFDEAQMLPPQYLRPILAVLDGLASLFGVSAVLCTATQPALEGRIGSGEAAFPGLAGVRELMPDPASLSKVLRRVAISIRGGVDTPTQWNELANELAGHDQALCIVNSRKDCRKLHAQLPPGAIHLSALMCGEHRSEVIAHIKSLLDRGASVRVVSTQLVEAGVDLDFPVVYRALAGLDSIAQAAGRCNREGKLNAAGHLGQVVVFAPPEPAPPGLLRKGEDAGREMLRCFPDLVTSLEPEAFDQYFRLFYGRVNDFDAKGIQALLGGPDARRFQIQFRSAAERFKLIDDAGQRAVVVWHASARVDSRKLLDAVRRFGPDRKRMRRLQRFTVNIPERVFNAFKAQGVLEEIEGLWAQAVPGLYDPVFGLRIEGPQWSGDEFVC